jgi:hypothetical protein
MGTSPASEPSGERLISNPQESYGDRFHDHLLEQYKLYVDSAQKVSEKRISASNYLLTVSSTILTLFGIAATQLTGAWLLIIPVAGLLVSFAWFSMVASYKNLNSAKFKVIHELEKELPAALFAYEWHHCEQGQGKAYTPITHVERWIPLIFAAVFLILGGYAISRSPQPEQPKPVAITGTVDVNVKAPMQIELKQNPPPSPPQKRQPKR